MANRIAQNPFYLVKIFIVFRPNKTVSGVNLDVLVISSRVPKIRSPGKGVRVRTSKVKTPHSNMLTICNSKLPIPLFCGIFRIPASSGSSFSYFYHLYQFCAKVIGINMRKT